MPSSFVTTSARTLCWRSRRPASRSVASWAMEMGSGVMTSDTRAWTWPTTSGSGRPFSFRIQLLSGGSGPRRAGTYTAGASPSRASRRASSFFR